MSKTEVILTHNIVGLGAESDQVKVAAGYARNYLFPQRLAVPLTQVNERHIGALRQRRAEREAHEFNTMTELSKALSKLICIIKVKAGEDGKMFGSVTAGMIADELKHQFDISLDKRKIHLEHPIRATGDHEVELNLHPEVKGTLKVRVESLASVAVPTPETAAPAEPKKEGSREFKRERHTYTKRDAKTEKDQKPEKARKPEAAGGKKLHTVKESHAVKGEKSEKPAKAAKAPKTEKQT
ncbi:MAG: 50S ribosomal protein L9 [Verrucomicrobiota bacterium]|jgi:large subunit ribosomal protein L9